MTLIRTAPASGKPQKDDTMKRLLALFATIMPLVFTTATRADLRDGLVGYWPFDGDAKDYSGNGNHGSTHGVSLTSDRHGNASSAYHFDGSDYISASASSSLNDISSAITIAAWIKPTAWDNHNENGDNLSEWIPVLQKGNEDRIQFQFMHARVGTTGWVRVDVSQEASIENARMPTIGVWQFVALTLSSGYLKYYRNGALSDSQYVGITLSRNSDPLFIGMDPWNVREYFTGNIDEISIYNRALTDSEIHALYNGNLKVCTISFVANGGEGNMAAQKPLTGTTLALPANTFTREGYLFQGWATSPDGPIVYSDGAEITLDSDKTLYAVWDNPALTVEAESADWSSGSMTLRCVDADTSGATHTYSLFYRDNGTWAMVPVESEGAVEVSAGLDGAAHLTDSGFASRQGGLGEVYYCVADENGRMSDSIPTRRRHGLPVGVGQYENAEGRGLKELRDAPALAREFGRVARQRGGFACREALAGSSATCRALDDALDEMAAKANPGDICLFYLNTHGGMDGTQGVFCMYDDDYFESRLIGKVQ